MKEYLSDIYQFIVLIAVVGLFVLIFIKTNQANDILLGAIVGVMVSMPANTKAKS